MNILKIILTIICKNIFNLFSFIIIFFNSSILISKEIIIDGNNFSDDQVIISIIGEIPEFDEKSQSNYILKKLNKSGLFKSVEVSFDSINFYVNIIEYPSINKIYYDNNDRLKDDQLDQIALELEVNNISDIKINKFIDELKLIYQSFGYNNIIINSKTENFNNNTANLILEFNEGQITKIRKININGNAAFESDTIISKIKSKTKKISNIFANNNFKIFQINNDIIRIEKFYKSEGYIDINVDYNVEYYENNKVEVNFFIDEGLRHYISNINFDNQLSQNNNFDDLLNDFISKNQNLIDKVYSINQLEKLETDLSSTLKSSGVNYFEINSYTKVSSNNVDILFVIKSTKPKYINQINISGNDRTYDYVIRREIDVAEGDPINDLTLRQIRKKLNNLLIFKNVDVEMKTSDEDEDSKNIEIDVEETQTGSFNVGFSVGSLDGISFLTGLKERNINGTGRSLEFLINTNDDNKEFTFSTSEKFIFNRDIEHAYSAIYKESDFATSKSYKLNALNLETNFNYTLSDNLYHTIGIGYQLKEYIITNSSTVSDNIAKSSGESISFNLNNDLIFNTLNSFIKPTKGNYFLFANSIQTPSSSSNGYFKNIITFKKYFEIKNDIYSIQTKLGNIYSLNDSEILSDDKFSLGGRWLRGFDNYGAGPRDSRTSYVGGNNIIAAKFDYSRPITLNDQNPIYLNLFNDYGLVWGNQNNVTSSDETVRSSYGFGINYYSPIGPIGFTWGFPINDKDYDIKRMFTFSIGNLN